MFGFLRQRRRERIRGQPFPAEWLGIVERNVPMYARLSEDDRRELQRRVLVFLAEKRFEGAGGLQMTDEIRVTIAAQACVLLLHLDEDDDDPRLRSIVVYPSAYRVPAQPDAGGVVHEDEAVHLGESWSHGAVVLSWNSARRGAADPRDGRNAILHEFAHQLDQEDGAVDGTPELDRWALYAPWARVLSEHYLALRDAADRGRRTLLDPYGATNEAEFFRRRQRVLLRAPGAASRPAPRAVRGAVAVLRAGPGGDGGVGAPPRANPARRGEDSIVPGRGLPARRRGAGPTPNRVAFAPGLRRSRGRGGPSASGAAFPGCTRTGGR